MLYRDSQNFDNFETISLYSNTHTLRRGLFCIFSDGGSRSPEKLETVAHAFLLSNAITKGSVAEIAENPIKSRQKLLNLFCMRKCILFIVLMVSVLLVSCAPNNSNSSSSNTTKVSTEFTSEQDVKDYCYGKKFTIPYVGVSTTGNSSNVFVKSYSGSTAIISVNFDMSEVYGRAVTSSCMFEINKQTGTCMKYTDPRDEDCAWK